MLKQKKLSITNVESIGKTLKFHFEASDEGIWPRKNVETMSDLKDQIGTAVTSLRRSSL